MRKMIIIGGAFLFALLPAGLGLAANPSLSARVPIPPAQVRSVSPTVRPTPTPTESEHPEPEHSEPEHTARPTARPSASPDDHGGDRHRGGSGRGRHSGHDG